MKKFNKISSVKEKPSFINMKMRNKSKKNVRVAWQDTVNITSAELRKRPLTMQIRTLAERSKRKKSRGPESALHTATWPMIYIIRTFGLGPYEFNENQLLVPSNTNMIFTIIWIIISTWIIYTILLQFVDAPKEDRGLLRFTEIIKVVSNYSVLIFDLLVCIYTRKQVTKIWNDIEDYDEIVRRLGYPRREKSSCIWVWSTLIFYFSILIPINQLGMYAFAQSWLDNIAYMILYVATAASVVKFSGIVLLLGQRFHHLNKITQKTMVSTLQWVAHISMKDIRIIERIHSDLMSTVEHLNSIYSWSIILWLGNLSLHSVSNLYFVTAWILDGCFYMDLIYCLLTWIIFFISQLILLNYACHYASKEANDNGYIILEWKRQLYMHNSGLEIETSFHLINRQVNFTAAGCFNVNLPLLRTIAASLTTYLVILLQID